MTDSSETMALTPKTIRALRLLSEPGRSAHEDAEHLLPVLSALVDAGLAAREPYIAEWGGRVRECFKVQITKAGRARLADAALQEHKA